MIGVAKLATLTAIGGLPPIAGAQAQPAQPLQKIDIVRLDARFDKLTPLNVRVERIVGEGR